MTLISPPSDLPIIAHFILPCVHTWGAKVASLYKEQVRAADGQVRAWFAFCIISLVEARFSQDQTKFAEVWIGGRGAP